jgi:SAM-dependent methyltransferase
VPDSNYADSFGFQWILHGRTQLDSFTGLPISRDRVRRATGWPDDLRGETILEAGSGAGRFTEALLRTGATVFSFDYSAAVDANFANNGMHPGLFLFQGDIYDIPVRERAFDKVFCLGVLQHTPDPERAFRSLVRHLRPGGEMAVDVYAKRATAVLSWKYLLRPITRRMQRQRLYRIVERTVDALLPLAISLRRLAGRLGARMLPIVEYSHLGLAFDVNREWAVLDTFDMYSPAHDHPCSLATVRRWFIEAGFEHIAVENGPNGVVGRGRLAEADR